MKILESNLLGDIYTPNSWAEIEKHQSTKVDSFRSGMKIASVLPKISYVVWWPVEHINFGKWAVEC